MAPDIAGVRATAVVVGAGELAAADLARDALERVAEEDARWHCLTAVDAPGVLRDAARIDAAVRGGTDPGELAGVTVVVKEVIDVAGLPTGFGIGPPVRSAGADAACVARLRTAGALVLGSTRTSPLAWRDDTPPAVNPLGPSLSTGGSSGGSAVAVAAGLAAGALGTDTGGSIRWPAAQCGIVGLRPTLGAIALDGVLPCAPTLDTVGVMARDTGDVRALLAALVDDAGLADRLRSPGAPPRLAGCRFGVPRHPSLTLLDRFAARAHGDLERRLADAGAGVVDVDLPLLRHANAAVWAISLAESTALQDVLPAAARAQVDDGTRHELELGRLLPASLVERARRLRVLLRDAVRDAFATHRLDALLVPASPLGAVHRNGRAAPLPEGHGGLSGASYLASLTGQPALVLPLLRGPEPIGVQLVGRPWADDALLDVAATLEAALM